MCCSSPVSERFSWCLDAAIRCASTAGPRSWLTPTTSTPWRSTASGRSSRWGSTWRTCSSTARRRSCAPTRGSPKRGIRPHYRAPPRSPKESEKAPISRSSRTTTAKTTSGNCCTDREHRRDDRRRLAVHFRHHAFGEPLEVADLLVQRFGVGPRDVRQPEAHDHVGDALVLEALDPIDGERVDGDDVDLERTLSALLLAELLEPRQKPVEFLRRAAAVHPPVAPRGAAQRRIGMPADQNRDRLRGGRGHLRFRDFVELAVKLEVVAAGQAADDRDALIHPVAALSERHIHQLVVLGPRTRSDAEPESVAEHSGQ